MSDNTVEPQKSGRCGQRPSAFTVSTLTLAAVQLGDGVACAAQAPRLVEALDKVNCPAELRKALPVVKIASAGSLALGLKHQKLGVVTAGALSAYFLAAIGFHARAKDDAEGYVPAVALLIWSLLTLRGFTRNRASSPTR